MLREPPHFADPSLDRSHWSKATYHIVDLQNWIAEEYIQHRRTQVHVGVLMLILIGIGIYTLGRRMTGGC